MKYISAFLVCFCSFATQAQPPEGWGLFAKTKFETKFDEKAAEYFLFPAFSPEAKATVGKEVAIEGYYMPITIEGDAYIILSKYPYSQCFFCGAAGPETICEVKFKDKQGKFELDQYIRVRGKLKLNESDVDHTNFILEDAVIVGK